MHTHAHLDITLFATGTVKVSRNAEVFFLSDRDGRDFNGGFDILRITNNRHHRIFIFLSRWYSYNLQDIKWGGGVIKN